MKRDENRCFQIGLSIYNQKPSNPLFITILLLARTCQTRLTARTKNKHHRHSAEIWRVAFTFPVNNAWSNSQLKWYWCNIWANRDKHWFNLLFLFIISSSLYHPFGVLHEIQAWHTAHKRTPNPLAHHHEDERRRKDEREKLFSLVAHNTIVAMLEVENIDWVASEQDFFSDLFFFFFDLKANVIRLRTEYAE